MTERSIATHWHIIVAIVVSVCSSFEQSHAGIVL